MRKEERHTKKGKKAKNARSYQLKQSHIQKTTHTRIQLPKRRLPDEKTLKRDKVATKLMPKGDKQGNLLTH